MSGCFFSLKTLLLSFNGTSFEFCEYGWTWIIHICDMYLSLWKIASRIQAGNEPVWINKVKQIMQDSTVTTTETYFQWRRLLGNVKTGPPCCGLLFPISVHCSPLDTWCYIPPVPASGVSRSLRPKWCNGYFLGLGQVKEAVMEHSPPCL